MNAPQIIVIVILALRLGITAANDQKPVPAEMTKYSFGRAFLQVGTWAALLWWGGFFTGGAA